MTKFFREFKTPFFCPKNVFPENPILSCAISYGFIQIQFQQNTWTDREMEGQTEGWKDYFIGPLQLCLGVQNHCKVSILATDTMHRT